MAERIQAIRGFNDILPEQSGLWRYLDDSVRSMLDAHGYQQIRLPVMESTQLFARSIGEVTDIVEKEMYTFADRNGDSLTLRPEGTAGCVRACEEHGLLYNQIQRLWYQGPMFRHERPQKGRYRQFHQIGVETFGMTGPDIDAELVIMTARLWQRLGLSQVVSLEINSLGSNAARVAYKEKLQVFLQAHIDQLDADSQKRVEGNPLRVLDSKDENTRRVLAEAPCLLDHLDEESRGHFERFKSLLSAAGVAFTVNPRLVRGLDYYNRSVFEWVTSALGAQGTVCAGGRYDGLVEQLGGKTTPAVGFAMGVERLVLLLESVALPVLPAQADVYIVAAGERAETQALLLADSLRGELPSLRVMLNCGGGSFKSQFKRADKSGARYALILGDDELARGEVMVKPLRVDQQHVEKEHVEKERIDNNCAENEQSSVPLATVAALLAARLL